MTSLTLVRPKVDIARTTSNNISTKSQNNFDRTARMRDDSGSSNLPQTDFNVTQVSDPIERRVQEFRMILSTVSMHYDKQLVQSLSKQLPIVFNSNTWDDEDILPEGSSLLTLMRAVWVTGAKHCPGLGTNGQGSITAAWTIGRNRLTLECMPRDAVQWIVTREINGNIIHDAGSCNVKLLAAKIRDFDPKIWFDQ